MAILKLKTNEAYKIALKYKSGVDVKSKFDGVPQLMFTLSTGDILYLPVAVGDSIKALNLGVMEPFILTKLSTANQISWSVERVPVPPAPAAPGPVLVPDKPKELPVNGQGENALRIALYAAIDEAADAEKYAAEKGLNIRFDQESIRCFANTLVIGMGGR